MIAAFVSAIRRTAVTGRMGITPGAGVDAPGVTASMSQKPRV